MKTTYDPKFQLEVAKWMPWSLTREAYEALCRECGVTPMSDDEILDTEYALRYGEFSQAEWLKMSREKRVLFQLNSRRLHEMDGDELEDDELDDDDLDAADLDDDLDGDEMMVCPRCGEKFPRKQRMMSAVGAVCPDCYDEASF